MTMSIREVKVCLLGVSFTFKSEDLTLSIFMKTLWTTFHLQMYLYFIESVMYHTHMIFHWKSFNAV